MKKQLFYLFLSILWVNLTVSAETVNLSGTWQFALDTQDRGISENWFNRALPDKISLPGVLQAQNYGNEIAADTPWVLSLYDKNWFLRADYQDFFFRHE